MKHATTPNWQLKIWSSGQSVLGRSISGSDSEVGIEPTYFWGWSIPQVEMCLGPKYGWGQSECGAKVVLGSNWVWAISKSAWILLAFASLLEVLLDFKKEVTHTPNKFHSFFNHRLSMLGFKLFFCISFFIVWIEASRQNFQTTEDPRITQILEKGKHCAMINSRKLKLILI